MPMVGILISNENSRTSGEYEVKFWVSDGNWSCSGYDTADEAVYAFAIATSKNPHGFAGCGLFVNTQLGQRRMSDGEIIIAMRNYIAESRG